MTENLRQRKTAAGGTATSNGVVGEKAKLPRLRTTEKKQSISVLDILRLIAGLIVLNCALSYFITNDSFLWGWKPWFVRPKAVMRWWVRYSSVPCRFILLCI